MVWWILTRVFAAATIALWIWLLFHELPKVFA